MDALDIILTFLGGGTLAGVLSFVIQRNQEKRADKTANTASYQSFVSDIYKEIGRLTQEVTELRKEREELYDELILQRERNAEIKTQYEILQNNYNELLRINRDLRNKIEKLLKKEEA